MINRYIFFLDNGDEDAEPLLQQKEGEPDIVIETESYIDALTTAEAKSYHFGHAPILIYADNGSYIWPVCRVQVFKSALHP